MPPLTLSLETFTSGVENGVLIHRALLDAASKGTVTISSKGLRDTVENISGELARIAEESSVINVVEDRDDATHAGPTLKNTLAEFFGWVFMRVRTAL